VRGGLWEITYGEHTGMVEDCRGLHYIALLLQRGTAKAGPIHAKELVALATGHDADATELELSEPILDTVAQQQLVTRLHEIAAARDRACAAEDFDRAAALDEEHEQITEQLSRARSPKSSKRGSSFNHASERARKAVAKAISEAIGRVHAHGLASLAEHLSSSIRKGQWLSYDGHADWHIQLSGPLLRK
jgi:translation initiation factor IF-2